MFDKQWLGDFVYLAMEISLPEKNAKQQTHLKVHEMSQLHVLLRFCTFSMDW